MIGVAPGRGMLRGLAAPVLASVAFALWRALSGDPLTDRAQDRMVDTWFTLRGARPAPAAVVLVAVDEAAVDRFGWSPPPREAFGRAIAAILAARPAVIAVDMLFLDSTDRDAPLSEALASSDGRVVLGAAASFDAGQAPPRSPALDATLARSALPLVVGPAIEHAPPRLYVPNDAFLLGVRLAHVNIIAAADGVARRVPLAQWVGDDVFLPALSLAAALDAQSLQGAAPVLRPGKSLAIGDRLIRTDRDGAVRLNYYGDHSAIRTVGLNDLLDGRVPEAVFAGRAVFFGVTAEGLSDVFATPFDTRAPGVEVLATLGANLVHDDLLVKGPGTTAADVALAAVLALALVLAARLRALPLVAVVGIAVWLIGLGLPFAGFTAANLVLDGPSAVFALTLASIWGGLARLQGETRRSIRLDAERRNLARYVSPILADDLARSRTPVFEGRIQQATVLFVDVAGYTAISEALTPAATAGMLRALHGVYESCAEAHRGVVVGYAGDGAMIAFGLPEPEANDAARALDCGRALVSAGQGLHPPGRAAETLRLRVSVHSGPVEAGLAGGRLQAQVTLNGDTVNVASRLQEVARSEGAAFVISRATLDAAQAADPRSVRDFAPLVTASLRGRVHPVEVWAT